MNGLLSATTQVLYRYFLKPIFFQFDPEFTHNQNVLAGKTLGKIPFAKKFIDWMWAYHNPELTKTLDGITFPNPVGLSAGFDYNGDLSNILPSIGFGFHTIGTVTLKSYAGNPPPRLGRFPRSRALLVNKGLKNAGAVAIIKKLKKCHFEIPTGISIASTNQHFASEKEQIEDIFECFYLFEASKLSHAYYELNISCPNTFGGEPFTSSARLEKLMKKMDQLDLSRPLYIKMPIDQSEKETLALLNMLAKHNVQGVIFGNLTKDKTNPAVHPEDRKVWLTRKGNLSGKPTWQRSNNLVALTRKHFGTRFTIIGTGGIFSDEDALQKLEAGADLVQLITGMIYEGPQVIGNINRCVAESLVQKKRMNKYKAIGFDRTGVISGKPSNNFNQTICEITGSSIEEYQTAYHHHNEAFNTGKITIEELWKRVLTDMDKFSLLDKVLGVVNKPKELNIEVVNLIKELIHHGYKVGLLSNDTHEAAKYMREVEHLDELFEILLVSSETGLVKPNKEAFLDLISKLKIKHRELIFIDDTKVNLSAAEQLGISTVLCTDPRKLRGQLQKRGVL